MSRLRPTGSESQSRANAAPLRYRDRNPPYGVRAKVRCSHGGAIKSRGFCSGHEKINKAVIHTVTGPGEEYPASERHLPERRSSVWTPHPPSANVSGTACYI